MPMGRYDVLGLVAVPLELLPGQPLLEFAEYLRDGLRTFFLIRPKLDDMLEESWSLLHLEGLGVVSRN